MATANTYNYYNFLALTLTHYAPKLTDQIMGSNPFLKIIQRAATKFSSGKNITETLITGNTRANITGFVGNEQWDTTETNLTKKAVYEWVRKRASVVFNVDELELNSGEEELFDILSTQTRVVQRDFGQMLVEALLGSSWDPIEGEHDPKQFHGLGDFTSDTIPVGGIDPATNEFWRPYRNVGKTFNPETLYTDLQRMDLETGEEFIEGEGEGGFIICGIEVFTNYLNQAGDKIRLQPSDPANLGFANRGTTVDGTPMYFDRNVDPYTAYKVNFNSLKWRQHRKLWWHPLGGELPGGFKRTDNSQEIKRDHMFLGQATINQRRTLGVLSYVDPNAGEGEGEGEGS